MGLFKRNRSGNERRKLAPSPNEEIGTRYRSDLDMSEAVARWIASVSASYGGVQPHRTVGWDMPTPSHDYRPYGPNELISGVRPITPPAVVLAIDVQQPHGVVYLAAWPEIVSLTMTRPIVELWCVTPDDKISAFDRQRLERNWHDSTLSRLGLVERGLWGVIDNNPA